MFEKINISTNYDHKFNSIEEELVNILNFNGTKDIIERYIANLWIIRLKEILFFNCKVSEEDIDKLPFKDVKVLINTILGKDYFNSWEVNNESIESILNNLMRKGFKIEFLRSKWSHKIYRCPYANIKINSSKNKIAYKTRQFILKTIAVCIIFGIIKFSIKTV